MLEAVKTQQTPVIEGAPRSARADVQLDARLAAAPAPTAALGAA